MCGRYLLEVASSSESLRRFVEICNKSSDPSASIPMDKTLEICPGNLAPVLMVAKNRLCAVAMRWGFPSKSSRCIINARSEDARERKTFCALLDGGRCAIPASGYFEWRDGDHQKYLINSKSGAGFYLAGLCRLSEQGEAQFVVLTRSAFGPHAKVHRRMPLVLSDAEAAKKWIFGEFSLEALAAQEPGELSIHAVGGEQLQMQW